MDRIAEEAAINAIQHSGCNRIEIAVNDTQEGLTLQVRDNGKGFDPDQVRRAPGGLGLLRMEYWAEKAGLHLTIAGKSGKGSTILVTAAG
jgi:signal transduction histidine kinase